MECKRQFSSQFITNLDIRWYKNSDVYKKNTRHCIYGQDADLIMLSLLSHEPNFTIIREEVKYKREQVEGIVRNEFIITNNFQLLYLPLLREYLDMEFKSTIDNMELEYNLERVIDDIIFFCFFVGNDFLPSLSVLDIAEASVDTLFDIYKVTLPEIGDYITENGLIYWDRAEKLIKALASHELEILHVRMQKIMNFEKRAEYQEAQFLKGEERIQYFRLKEKERN
jgi:5'-3' exoribonuclease 1